MSYLIEDKDRIELSVGNFLLGLYALNIIINIIISFGLGFKKSLRSILRFRKKKLKHG